MFDFQRMVHLGGPPDPQGYRGQPRRSAADKELLLNGQDAGDESLEASGFNGSDMEERERAEEGGESLEPRGRQQTWAREEEPNGGAGANHTAPDLDALIGQCCGGHQEMLIGLQLLFFLLSSGQSGYQRPLLSADSQLDSFSDVPALKVEPEVSSAAFVTLLARVNGMGTGRGRGGNRE